MKLLLQRIYELEHIRDKDRQRIRELTRSRDLWKHRALNSGKPRKTPKEDLS